LGQRTKSYATFLKTSASGRILLSIPQQQNRDLKTIQKKIPTRMSGDKQYYKTCY